METRSRAKVRILSTELDNISLAQLLQDLKSGVVFTPNVDHLIKLRKDRAFREAYDGADYKVCDGQILLFASWFLGTPIREKISGSDFFPAFYRHHANNPQMKIFLLGAAEGVARKAQVKINRKVGRDIVVGVHSPSFGFEKNELECAQIVEMIQASGANVLAVGVGAPKQEKWIHNYKHLLTHIDIFLAIGATIDFEAGAIQRAPRWMSSLGLEWLYRITRDPKRLWRRYLIEDLPFFWLLLKQKLVG